MGRQLKQRNCLNMVASELPLLPLNVVVVGVEDEEEDKNFMLDR